MITVHFYLSILLFLTLIITIYLFFLLYKKQLSHFRYVNLPPGQLGLPYIGETLEFVSAARNGHPEKFISDRVSTYSADIFKTSIFTEPTVVVCDTAGHKFLFSNESKLVTPWWPESFRKVFQGVSTKAEAKRNRKMLTFTGLLKAKELERHIGIIDDIAQRHFMMEWENMDQVVALPLVKKFIFWVACRIFWSSEDPDHLAEFIEPLNIMVSGLLSIPVDLPGTQLNKAKKACDFIKKKLIDVIKQRKLDLAKGNATPTQDMLSYMLLTPDEDGMLMTELEIARPILGLLVASHDTTSSACIFVIKYLAELPHIYEAVYQEQMDIAKTKAPGELLKWDDLRKMRYSWNVVCEVMRLTPPAHGGFREALTDFTYNGFTIPKGWKLYWSTYSTHRNPKHFRDPEKFDPSRFDGKGPAPYTFVPFGGGPRMCPGNEYARMTILVFIHNLVKRFRWEKVLPEEKITIYPSPAPVKGLPILLYPHQV